MKKIFITGTGTGIGKTFVTAALAYQLRKMGKAVLAVKPIITGWDDSEDSDTRILMRACDLADIDECSPWRYTAPLAADMAAAREGREVDFNKLVKFCSTAFNGVKLIEGAGGIMSPVNKDKTFLDLTNEIPGRIILVAGTYLGSISHTLTALEVLKGRDVKLVINESPDSEVTPEEAAASIRQFTYTPVMILKKSENLEKLDLEFYEFCLSGV